MSQAQHPWVAGNAGVQTSIFIGGFGNNITKPAETTATEFVVIEDVACTPTLPSTGAATSAGTTVAGQLNGWTQATAGAAGAGTFGPRGYVQVRINTTDYFLNPDNVTNDGIPGTGSPYPRSLDFQPSFNLYPDVYVLPGQVWDVRYTAYCAQALTGEPRLLVSQLVQTTTHSVNTLFTMALMHLSLTSCWRWVFLSTQEMLTGISEAYYPHRVCETANEQ